MPRAHEHLMPHRRRLAHVLLLWMLALACLLVCGCSTTTITEEQPSKPVSQVIPATLAIVHTGGARGSFSADGVACPAVAARLAHDLREEGFDVLLLDSGDTLHGSDPTDLSYGEDAIGFLNAAGYDALALGTSELDLGQETLRARDLQGDFPLLSANVTTDEDAPQVMPHEVFALSDGRTIGVFALTAPAAATQASPLALRGITLSTDELAAIAQQQVGELRGEGCRLIVCLTNLGDGTDSQLDATTLASQVSGIDILLDAGAEEEGHKVVKDASDDETLVVETAAAPGAVSVVTWARGTLSVTPHQVGQGEAADEQVDALVTQTGLELEHRLSQALTEAGFPLPLPQGAEESTLGDLASDAILWQARRSAPDAPDAAVITSGSLAAAIDEGDVTRGDALLVMPQATSRLCVIEVSGTQLQETLAGAVDAAPDDPARMPQVSGIACTIDARDAHDPKVTITEVGGHAFSPTETYRIATLEPLLLAELERADDEAAADMLAATTRLDVSGGEALASYLARRCKGSLPKRYQEPQRRLVTQAGTKS